MRQSEIIGHVIAGKAEGRTLGYPTANLELNPGSSRPQPGVYAAWITGNALGRWPGVLVSGVHWESEDLPRIEVHLVGYQGDLYGTELSVEVVQRLRDIVIGLQKNELIELIENDIAKTRVTLGLTPEL